MTLCKGCNLAKIQQPSLSSINRMPHHHFAYDTVLRNLHSERPNSIEIDSLLIERVFMDNLLGKKSMIMI
jgi:hypothetical protein